VDTTGNQAARGCFGKQEKERRKWETRAARKIKKRVRNRTPKNRNKNQKTRLTGSQKESLDSNQGAEFFTTALPV
jgi:hypothetical protein